MEWISVKDRLPENVDNVLVFCEKQNEAIEVAFYNTTDKEWQGLSQFYTKRITHWMPLPEPPSQTT